MLCAHVSVYEMAAAGNLKINNGYSKRLMKDRGDSSQFRSEFYSNIFKEKNKNNKNVLIWNIIKNLLS